MSDRGSTLSISFTVPSQDDLAEIFSKCQETRSFVLSLVLRPDGSSSRRTIAKLSCALQPTAPKRGE